MSTDTPSWLSEPCPEWCSGDHDDQQCPADHQHQSLQRWQPAVVLHRRRGEDGAIVRYAEATEFCVVAMRYADEQDTWVAIATETQQFELSRESADRLYAELRSVLDKMG